MRPKVRKITSTDNSAIANIIRTVMPEFGASGQGFAIHDREVDDMFSAYNSTGAAYFVCEEEGKLIGGGGIGPLLGGPEDTCELKKMYFLQEGRGRGLGHILLSKCLESARTLGYRYCYLETFNTMKAGMRLYERSGFERIPAPLGNTGHFACDVFYRLRLT